MKNPLTRYFNKKKREKIKKNAIKQRKNDDNFLKFIRK